ncbi:MAG: DNA polymerase III subunit gamma/tau [Flavobacteriales bacterium]|nr:DNA polymerase III subunit gamma/tau [Flavobacteriales bacterium]
MENFIVSARKYRPQDFESVVGQRSITHTLQNAIKSDHLAQALLFCGPRGVGKTTCARILAKAINLDDANVALTGGDDDFSFNIFELDAASNNSVDDIRNLIDQVRFAPPKGRYKVYIIDEVHMLSQAAFNAFLKTLEEPPAHAIFILATTEKHKIIPTILSRCQIFDFNRIGVEDIVGHLQYVAEQEGVSAEQDALHIIAQKADGAMRDALSIFDRMVSFSGNTLSYEAVIDNLNILDYEYYFKLVEHLVGQDIQSSLLLFDEVLKIGFDGHHFINGLAEHLRNLLVCQDEATLQLLQVGEKIKERYRQQAAACSIPWLVRAMELANGADVQYKNSNNQRLLVEITLMQLCSLDSSEVKKKVDEEARILGPAEAKVNYKGSAEAAATATAPTTASASPATATASKGSSHSGIRDETPSPEHPFERSEESRSPEPISERSEEKPPVEPPSPPPSKVLEEVPTPASSRRDRKRKVAATLSINNLLQEQEEKAKEKPVIESDSPKGQADAFDQDRLQYYWDLYCDKLKEEQKWSLMNTLNKHKPNLGADFHVTFEVENNIQRNEIEKEKPELMEFMRTRLNNFQMQLEVIVLEHSQVKQLYTPQEKFKHMAEKNPALLDLQRRLDLDVDF